MSTLILYENTRRVRRLAEMLMPGTRLLVRSEMRQVLKWPAILDAVRNALLMRAVGNVAPLSSLQLSTPSALLHLKAGALTTPAILSVKANLRPQGGNVTGLVVLFDIESGTITAVMDSAEFTAMRTAALATLAAETLIQPHPTSLAVLGAGPVARQILEVFPTRIPVERVQLWSRSREKAEDFVKTLQLPVTVHDTPAQAAQGCTVVVTATPSRVPYLEGAALDDGTLVLAMGADSSGKRELSASVLAEAAIIADQHEDVLKVGESAYLAEDQVGRIWAELGDILAGKASVPNYGDGTGHRVLVFDSVGSAIVDAMVANTIAGLAKVAKLGRTIDFAS